MVEFDWRKPITVEKRFNNTKPKKTRNQLIDDMEALTHLIEKGLKLKLRKLRRLRKQVEVDIANLEVSIQNAKAKRTLIKLAIKRMNRRNAKEIGI